MQDLERRLREWIAPAQVHALAPQGRFARGTGEMFGERDHGPAPPQHQGGVEPGVQTDAWHAAQAQRGGDGPRLVRQVRRRGPGGTQQLAARGPRPSGQAQEQGEGERTDRILAACAYHEIPTHLVLNKVDLDRRGATAEIRETYERIGVPVLLTSAEQGLGLDELADLLRGKTSALYGGSGVGKSTLLNRLEPGLALKVGKISSYWEQGKHTTSYSQVHELPGLQARVIDTPGIRVFRLYGVNERELRDAFPELLRYGADCRYPGCSHTHEPGCAVHAAFERGDIAPTRFESYVEMLSEAVPVSAGEDGPEDSTEDDGPT